MDKLSHITIAEERKGEASAPASCDNIWASHSNVKKLKLVLEDGGKCPDHD